MPTDLTAPQLIALLREHPGACGMLGIQTHSTDNSVDCWKDEIQLRPRYLTDYVNRFRRWLTGAAVERLLELGIKLPKQVSDGWRCYLHAKAIPFSETGQTSFLHAALAALEQHAKESK